MKKGIWANIYFIVFTFLLLHLKSKTEICSGIIKLWSRSRTASKIIQIPKFLCIVQYTGMHGGILIRPGFESEISHSYPDRQQGHGTGTKW